MEKDLHEQAVRLMESIFEKCDPKLKSYAYVRREDLRIAMPDIFLQIFIDGLSRIYGFEPSSVEEAKHYRGIKIIPNYEMSIVFFHKEYPKTKESWMIYKVWLETPNQPNLQLPDISGLSS